MENHRKCNVLHMFSYNPKIQNLPSNSMFFLRKCSFYWKISKKKRFSIVGRSFDMETGEPRSYAEYWYSNRAIKIYIKKKRGRQYGECNGVFQCGVSLEEIFNWTLLNHLNSLKRYFATKNIKRAQKHKRPLKPLWLIFTLIKFSYTYRNSP